MAAIDFFLGVCEIVSVWKRETGMVRIEVEEERILDTDEVMR
jgi:hypothetical protein